MTRIAASLRSSTVLLALAATTAASVPALAQGYDRSAGWGLRTAMKYDRPADYYTGAGFPVYAAAYSYSPYAFRTAYGCLPYNVHCPW